jgi:hypothetical protein
VFDYVYHGSRLSRPRLKARFAGLWVLKKHIRLRLLWWSGFSGGVGAVLKNVWQNGFTNWIEIVKEKITLAYIFLFLKFLSFF